MWGVWGNNNVRTLLPNPCGSYDAQGVNDHHLKQNGLPYSEEQLPSCGIEAPH
jgi:hypothetical protein